MNSISDSFLVSAGAMTIGTVLFAKGCYDVRNNRPLAGRLEQGMGVLCIIGGIAEQYLFTANEEDIEPLSEPSYQKSPPDEHAILIAERNRRQMFHQCSICIEGTIDLVKSVGEKIWVCYANGTEGFRS